MSISDNKVAQLISISKVTQSELAEVLGVTQSYVSRAAKKGFRHGEKKLVIDYIKTNHLNKKREIEKILSEVDHD